MWVYLEIIGMTLGAGYWVVYPLLNPRKFDSPAETPSVGALGDLKIKKEEIYSAIKEMEFDYKMGKLSEEDYLDLREKYRAKAIGSIQRMDELEREEHRSKDFEDEIEKEILALRRDGRKERPKRGEVFFCNMCGRRRSPGDKFCSWCGTRLAKV